MSISIVSHGGGCCGIRVIKGLGTNPKTVLEAKEMISYEKLSERWDNDLNGYSKHPIVTGKL